RGLCLFVQGEIQVGAAVLRLGRGDASLRLNDRSRHPCATDASDRRLAVANLSRRLAEFALCLALPFFFSGVVVSLALTRSPYPIGKVYGADLIGCIGALVLLNMTSGPSAVLWVGAVIGLAALGFANSGLGNLNESASFGAKLFRYRRSILTG